MNIEKVPVTSSNIEAIGYDEETQTLRIWFKVGTVYDYEKVELRIFVIMQTAPSVGNYFANNIKGKYSFKKL